MPPRNELPAVIHLRRAAALLAATGTRRDRDLATISLAAANHWALGWMPADLSKLDRAILAACSTVIAELSPAESSTNTDRPRS